MAEIFSIMWLVVVTLFLLHCLFNDGVAASRLPQIESEVLADSEKINANESQVLLKNKMPKGSEYKIFCYDSSSDFDITKIWSPLTVIVTADAESWVRVKHAATDNLHTILDNQVQKLLGISESMDIKDRLVERKSFLFFPKPSIFTDCPSILWSANKSECVLHLSPFGESCISVSSRSFKNNKPGYFTVETSSSYEPKLMYFFMTGMMLFVLSHEMSKSKIFQYSGGALAGMVSGILLTVLFILRKKKGVAASPLILGTAYFGSLYLAIKQYSVTAISGYWEYILVYLALMFFLGLLLTYKLRSDPELKHRTRVIVKWLIRCVGFVFLFHSTFSWYVEAMWFVLILLIYINHKLGKKRAKKEKSSKKKPE